MNETDKEERKNLDTTRGARGREARGLVVKKVRLTCFDFCFGKKKATERTACGSTKATQMNTDVTRAVSQHSECCAKARSESITFHAACVLPKKEKKYDMNTRTEPYCQMYAVQMKK